MPESYTIPEFAALCRERCTRIAQGYDDDERERRPCGDQFLDDEGRTVSVFCGQHWVPVLGATTGDHDA